MSFTATGTTSSSLDEVGNSISFTVLSVGDSIEEHDTSEDLEVVGGSGKVVRGDLGIVATNGCDQNESRQQNAVNLHGCFPLGDCRAGGRPRVERGSRSEPPRADRPEDREIDDRQHAAREYRTALRAPAADRKHYGRSPRARGWITGRAGKPSDTKNSPPRGEKSTQRAANAARSRAMGKRTNPEELPDIADREIGNLKAALDVERRAAGAEPILARGKTRPTPPDLVAQSPSSQRESTRPSRRTAAPLPGLLPRRTWSPRTGSGRPGADGTGG